MSDGGPWSLYELDPPAKWQAGRSGDTTFYFDCAGCRAHEPEIAGFIGTGPTFAEIGLIPSTEGRPFVKTAMYCVVCWPRVRSGELLPKRAATLAV